MSDTTTHVFRVELRPDLYREIEVFSGMPLDFFAAAIVKAFGFDFDHPYGFYSKLTGRVFASTPVPFTGQTVGGTVAPLTDRASPSGATFCPLCFEHLGGTRAPAAGRG